MENLLDPNDLLAQIELNLNRKRHRIAFSENIEVLFQKDTKDFRIKNYFMVIFISVFLFDSIIYPERLMMPDLFLAIKVLNLWIVTPLALLSIWLMWGRWISPSGAAAIFVLLVLSDVTLTMMGSHAPDAILLAFSIPMMLVYSTVLPLPFLAAFCLSCTCLATIGFLITFDPSFDVASRVFAIFLCACMTVFTLLSTYRLETTERRLYLLTLAQTMRAKLLSERNEVLLTLSDTDGLTGIGNRRCFNTTLDRLWTESGDTRSPLALLMIDIDHFKRLNDVHGHLGGDQCLQAVAGIIKSHVRTNGDAGFRFGGEEFVVLLSGAAAQGSDLVAERLRAAIDDTRIDIGLDTPEIVHVTVSIGHATAVNDSGKTPASLVSAADQALYAAKQNGRNCIHPNCLESIPLVRYVA